MEVFKERAVTALWFRNCGIVALNTEELVLSVIISKFQLKKIPIKSIRDISVDRNMLLGDRISLGYIDNEGIYKRFSYISRHIATWEKIFNSLDFDIAA